ncbi:CPBP family intramembrane metalloprotease [Spirosoma sp. 209]|uniref:CPBP family intramembrane metalloprotease n=1 Tax=Spirosoma sp. 209 TaxID=1955701 RepID=UPI00098D241D|nr:CPBP family intramembrane metalloprotease [Spirosoma sp. 209]
MRNAFSVCAAALCLFATSCHRPVAYFQRTPYSPARLAQATPEPAADMPEDTLALVADAMTEPPQTEPIQAGPIQAGPIQAAPLLASRQTRIDNSAQTRLDHRMRRVESMLTHPAPVADQQPGPGPKPKKQMRLGNKIRQALGMPLREELNWWQRISWKLKASVIVILVAILFAIFHVTILAVIFGLLGAFLLISGLRRSFKVRRPWF